MGANPLVISQVRRDPRRGSPPLTAPDAYYPYCGPRRPSEHTPWHKSREPDDSCTHFPTGADFEQAEIFVEEGFSGEHVYAAEIPATARVDLQVKTALEMRELFARRTEKGAQDDPTVRFTFHRRHRIPNRTQQQVHGHAREWQQAMVLSRSTFQSSRR